MPAPRGLASPGIVASKGGSIVITMTCTTWSAGYTSQKTSVTSRGADSGHGSFDTTTIGNGYTLQECYWNSVVNLLYVGYTATSVPDNDSSLYSIAFAGGPSDGTLLRTDKVGTYTGGPSGWVFSDTAPLLIPTSGSITLTITWR